MHGGAADGRITGSLQQHYIFVMFVLAHGIAATLICRGHGCAREPADPLLLARSG